MKNADTLEQEFLSAWQRSRSSAVALGVRMRPIREAGGLQQAKRLLAGSRLSDGFGELAALGKLSLSMEALAVDKRFTSLFTDEEANEALSRLLDAGYQF